MNKTPMWVPLAVFLLSCSQLASQIYMPVLPSIANSLALSAGSSQAIIASYFITLGLSQLIVGPMRDKFGDRPVFICGQATLLLGTVLCSIAPSASWFLLGRVLQGIGAASPLLISRTLLAAQLSGDKLKNAMATLAICSSVTSLLAPLFSGVLSDWFSWQGMSWVLVVYYSLITLYGLSLLKHTERASNSVHPKFLIKQYRELLKRGPFITVACIKWVPTFLYLTIQLYLPFLLSHEFGYSDKETGQAMMLPMLGLLIGSSVAKILQKRFSYLDLVLWFWPILLIGAVLFAVSEQALLFLLAYALIMLVFGVYFPSYMHLIGVIEPQKAGTANALVGAIELLVFTCLAWAINQWLLHSTIAVAVFVTCCAAVMIVAWQRLNARFAELSLQTLQGSK
ncbi:MFS transporter [Pseudoalteromonas fenneropenaei]|uniref:MFS transporter n=1 Tax=Pseudoalteromonas fenneropenaei TaxID=1737459 RepID=A0ABV7CJJ0_9GAMM